MNSIDRDSIMKLKNGIYTMIDAGGSDVERAELYDMLTDYMSSKYGFLAEDRINTQSNTVKPKQSEYGSVFQQRNGIKRSVNKVEE